MFISSFIIGNIIIIMTSTLAYINYLQATVTVHYKDDMIIIIIILHGNNIWVRTDCLN